MLLVGSNSESSVSVSVFCWPKQVGSVTMHAMLLWTAIGATSFSLDGAKTRACASARTVTSSMSKMRAKMPGAFAVADTSIVPTSGKATVGAGIPA